jgi:hypothetical protein
MDWKEACRILGVPESATDIEIKEQYIYKAQMLHPDKNQGKPEYIIRKAEAELALINQAYSFLGNPQNNPYKIPPKLAIEPMGIRFKDVTIGEKKSITLIVRNTGGPYTSVWMDNQPAPWLTVTGVKSITSERLPLEVALECTGSGEPGKHYTCDFLIKLENEITHTVDQAIVKIELNTVSAATRPAAQKDVSSPAQISGMAVPRDKPAPQPKRKNKTASGFITFLVDFLAFAVIGAGLAYLSITFWKPDEVILMSVLILFGAIAFGISFSHALKAGSKTAAAQNKKRQTQP